MRFRDTYTAILVQLFVGTGSTAIAESTTFSTYGTPGMVELPTARSMDESELSFGVAYSDISLRNTATFQLFPRLYASFRYSITDDVVSVGQKLYDRSFDIHLQLMDETDSHPAIAVGLRDFLGTGILSSEYVVATKEIVDGLSLTAGLGWGRLGGRNSFDNPLSYVGLNSQDRQIGFTGGGGLLEPSRWFQGQTAIFGGIDWKATDRLSFQLEYSSDLYTRETRLRNLEFKSPFNASVAYSYNDNLSGKLYVIAGSQVGLQLNFGFDPKERNFPGGREPAPRPILPREQLAAASWNREDANTLEAVLTHQLSSEGLVLAGFELSEDKVTIFIENNRWDVESQAAGRAARVLANTLSPEIESFIVVFQERGVPLSAISTQRTDLEELQYNYDAFWRTESRAQIQDAPWDGKGGNKLSYELAPYSAFSFFDPDNPIRADFGVQLEASYQIAPGFTIDGRARYPIIGNLDESTRESDSVIQRVRSESYLFASESELEINHLTAEYIWRPAPDMFARLTGGYLEDQFGGISTEVLWSPINSRIALGAEFNYAKQRNFDMLFGFQDYDIATGHVSAYFNGKNGFHTQVDLGRYLAGDWGGTLTINREFDNGVKVGGYFTLTDVPFEDFGEGSFDKGVHIEVPLSFFTGQPSRRVVSQNFQPILRDGGARLKVQNRLYPLTRNYRGVELSDGWGRYLR